MIKGNRCQLCGKRGDYKCSKCGKVCYCSRECQIRDWKTHKNNCKSSSKTKRNKNRHASLDKKVSFSNQIQFHNDKDHNIRHNEKGNNNSIEPNPKSSKRSRNISSDLNMKRDNKAKGINSSVNINNDVSLSSKNKNISTTGTTETATVNNETLVKEVKIPPPQPQIDKNKKEEFDFMQSLKEIIFMKKNKNKNTEEKAEDEEENSENFEDDEKFFLKNDKINLLYKLLIKHRDYVKEKVLLDPSKTYFFAKTVFFRDKFIEIEKYIFNYIILIKYLLLLSCLIKISRQLQVPKLYYKFLDHYGKLYELAYILINCI